VRQLFLIGVDGLPPTTLDRFLAEGILPNIASLQAQSGRLSVIPTLPAVTSPGWMTIGTGAHPATHGVCNLLQPRPGASPDSMVNGFDRGLVDAEYLWDAMSAQGEPAIVVKYPGSWPARPGSFIQVDGAGGYADITCRFEAVPSVLYLCGLPVPTAAAEGCCAVPRGFDDHYRIDTSHQNGHVGVAAREVLGWRELPDGKPWFETVLHVAPAGQQRQEVLYALAYEGPSGPRLRVSRSKQDTEAIADIGVGEWSPWIRKVSERGPFSYRFKLTRLDGAARIMRLYRSAGHFETGFTVPAEIAPELVEHAGPVCEWTGTFDFMNGLIDLDTQIEVYDAHTSWMERIIRHLATTREWRGFFMHYHVIEYAHHVAGSCLDPAHPMHERNKEPFLAFLRATYRQLDRMVGTIMEVAGPEAAIVLASDHGHDTVHTLVHVNEFLREAGWIVADEHDGDLHIDWDQSVAYALFPGLLVINRKSRWNGGIVDEADADALAEEIAARLRGLVDPRTGRPVITGVFDRTEMQAFGSGGPNAPDLFFTMDRGYEPATRLRSGNASYFVLTEPGQELTSGHGSFHPASSSARTLAMIRHPDVEPGSAGRLPVAMVDLAPTFAALMGVRPPATADGRPIDFSAVGIGGARRAGEDVR
jgi:predicted AlkP superfamily phosphohydrolase/phosphomutase